MLTYQQLANPTSWTTMNTYPQSSGGIIDGYALVMGGQDETLRKLTALLWEHGVPAYAAPNLRETDKTVAVRGAPTLILLHLDKVHAAAIVDLENFRLRYGVPLLCIAPADARQPHVQALMQVATDFIVAPYQPHELVLRIRRICASLRQSTTALVARRPAWTNSPLSDTERNILQRLAQNLGEPVHLDDLAEVVPGDTHETRIKLLRVHIFRMRQKLEPTPKNPKYVRTVRDYGYCLTQIPEGAEGMDQKLEIGE